MELLRRKINSGGFVFIEFAIALPLLVLLMYGLASVSMKIFQLGKYQLADYVLETEAQYVMERITQQARAAREFERNVDGTENKFVYRTITEKIEGNKVDGKNMIVTADVLETQYFIIYKKKGKVTPDLYAERRSTAEVSKPSNPITGDNFFGETAINFLQCDVDPIKKILHVSLEMKSLVTPHKIKLNTAVFMPSYGL